MRDDTGYDDWRRDSQGEPDEWVYGPAYQAYKEHVEQMKQNIADVAQQKQMIETWNALVKATAEAAQALAAQLAPIFRELAKQADIIAGKSSEPPSPPLWSLWWQRQEIYERSRADLAKKRREQRRRKGRV